MKKGFTLVELLVTTAILGVLSTLAVANFIDYKRKVCDMLAANYVNMAFIAANAASLEEVVGNSFIGFSIIKYADSTTWINLGVSIPVDAVFPGMLIPEKGVVMAASVTYDIATKRNDIRAWAFHCKGSPSAGTKIRTFIRDTRDGFIDGVFFAGNNKPTYRCSNY